MQILTHTAEGGRNDQLNHSAFKVGQLIAQGSLDAQLGINALTIAAQQMGLMIRTFWGPQAEPSIFVVENCVRRDRKMGSPR